MVKFIFFLWSCFIVLIIWAIVFLVMYLKVNCFVVLFIVFVVIWVGVEWVLVKFNNFFSVFGNFIFFLFIYCWRWLVILLLFCNVGR